MRFLRTESELSQNQRPLLNAYWREINKPEVIQDFALELFLDVAKNTQQWK